MGYGSHQKGLESEPGHKDQQLTDVNVLKFLEENERLPSDLPANIIQGKAIGGDALHCFLFCGFRQVQYCSCMEV